MAFKFWPQIRETKEMIVKTVTQSHLSKTYEVGAGQQYVYLTQREVPGSEIPGVLEKKGGKAASDPIQLNRPIASHELSPSQPAPAGSELGHDN